MITEQYKDKVYFSKWFKSDYPDIYHNVCNILDENNVAHDTLSLTKDYWCRDYMPVQFACGFLLNSSISQIIWRVKKNI